MHVLIATDKFKGSMSSVAAGNAIARGIRQQLPDAKITVLPVADGGDGFSAVLKTYLQSATRSVATVDPLHRSIHSQYEWQASTGLAVIEVAAANGLVLVQEADRDPLKSSTLGTGLLIQDALALGANKILLGLGGSATVDAGI